METLLVLTNLPDAASARALAEHLVAARLAACVEHPGALSVGLSLAGQLEEAEEVPLLIKTTAERYAALEAAIRARHPYELPEIVAVPIDHGLPAYLGWLAAETTPPRPHEC